MILLFLSDPTLTAHSITTAITTVEEWKDLSDRLGVPWSKRRQIDSECSTLHKKKEAVVLNWLQYQPGPSWTRLAHWLYYVEEQEALHQTLQYLKRPTGMDFIVSVCKVSQGVLQYVSMPPHWLQYTTSTLSWTPDPCM